MIPCPPFTSVSLPKILLFLASNSMWLCGTHEDCCTTVFTHSLIHTHRSFHTHTSKFKCIFFFLTVHIPFSFSHTHTYTFIKYPLRPLICFHFLANAQVLLPQFSISWQIYPVVWSFTNYSSNDGISLVNCGVPIIFSSKGLLPPTRSLHNTHSLTKTHTYTYLNTHSALRGGLACIFALFKRNTSLFPALYRPHSMCH